MENKELNDLLGHHLSVENMDLREPDPLLVFEARQTVLSHNKVMRQSTFILTRFIDFLQIQLKFYHLGFSLLLVTAGIFYSNLNSQGGDSRDLVNYNSEVLSIKNNTISVMSATMLTSIPTLRN
jgi:hypothetical protein